MQLAFKLGMSHVDPYSLSNSIGSTTKIPILYPNDYELWVVHMEDYVLNIEDHGSNIWEAMTVGPFWYIATRNVIKTQAQYNALVLSTPALAQDEKDKLMSNIKAIRTLRFALAPDTLRLVNSYTTAKEIWVARAHGW